MIRGEAIHYGQKPNDGVELARAVRRGQERAVQRKIKDILPLNGTTDDIDHRTVHMGLVSALRNGRPEMALTIIHQLPKDGTDLFGEFIDTFFEGTQVNSEEDVERYGLLDELDKELKGLASSANLKRTRLDDIVNIISPDAEGPARDSGEVDVIAESFNTVIQEALPDRPIRRLIDLYTTQHTLRSRLENQHDPAKGRSFSLVSQCIGSFEKALRRKFEHADARILGTCLRMEKFGLYRKKRPGMYNPTMSVVFVVAQPFNNRRSTARDIAAYARRRMNWEPTTRSIREVQYMLEQQDKGDSNEGLFQTLKGLELARQGRVSQYRS